MVSKSSIWLFAIVPLVVLLQGCHCCCKTSTAPAPTPTVDVGGLVKTSGTLEIPPNGLTLLQAIIRAGDLNFARTATTPGAINPNMLGQLVRVQRGNEVYHFPLHMVETDLAGAVQLAPNDIVQILPAGETSLFSGNMTSDAQKVVISGVHKLSGQYTPQQLVTATGGGTLPNAGFGVNQLLRRDIAARDGVYSTVVQLTRTNIRNGYLVEHFILPTENYPNGNDVLASMGLNLLDVATVQGGDQLVFSAIQTVPIIAAGVISPALHRAFANQAAVRNCCNQAKASAATPSVR